MKYHWEAHKLSDFITNLLREVDKALSDKQEKRDEARKELDSLIFMNRDIFNSWWDGLEKDDNGYPLHVNSCIDSLQNSLVSAAVRFDTERDGRTYICVHTHLDEFYERFKRVAKKQLRPHYTDFFTTYTDYIIVEVEHPSFGEWVRLDRSLSCYTPARNRLADSKESILHASSVTLSDRDIGDIKLLQEML